MELCSPTQPHKLAEHLISGLSYQLLKAKLQEPMTYYTEVLTPGTYIFSAEKDLCQ